VTPEINAPEEPLAAAVLLHPHPAIGGNKMHPFVDGVFRRVPSVGVAAVRFDFSSADVHIATGEVLLAIDSVAEHWPRIPVVIAGYSFGSSVAMQIDDGRVVAWFLLAPPAASLAVAVIGADPREKTIVVPERDQMSPPDVVEASTADWASTTVSTAPGVDHFLGDVGPIVDAAVRWVGLVVGGIDPSARA
jgi:alpha/beta superfamily hydrolase